MLVKANRVGWISTIDQWGWILVVVILLFDYQSISLVVQWYGARLEFCGSSVVFYLVFVLKRSTLPESWQFHAIPCSWRHSSNCEWLRWSLFDWNEHYLSVCSTDLYCQAGFECTRWLFLVQTADCSLMPSIHRCWRIWRDEKGVTWWRGQKCSQWTQLVLSSVLLPVIPD